MSKFVFCSKEPRANMRARVSSARRQCKKASQSLFTPGKLRKIHALGAELILVGLLGSLVRPMSFFKEDGKLL